MFSPLGYSLVSRQSSRSVCCLWNTWDEIKSSWRKRNQIVVFVAVPSQRFASDLLALVRLNALLHFAQTAGYVNCNRDSCTGITGDAGAT